MFGDKEFSQLGFPTPETTPDVTGCRLLQIPSSAAWFGVFMGCLSLLANPENWQQYEGGMSREDAAAVAQAVIDQAYALAALEVCEADVPTPYWDETSADDADDTMAAADQTWYGEIVAVPALMSGEELTFTDNLGIWLIAGFIAYAGLPGAAIAFVPVAKRFVLAFKQHSVGGIVRALVDFAEVAEIDTYGATDGVANLNIIMPDDGMSHTLYVEMSDTSNPLAGDHPNIQVIRKRLSESEVTPTNLRYNADCDCVQQTPDGGTTWIDNPDADPRRGSGYALPARTGDNAKCDAAANMVVRLKQIIAEAERDVAAYQMATAMLAVLAFFMGDVGIIADLILTVADALITIGFGEITLAFTDEQWALIECILYCDSQADGTLTADDLSKVLSDIHDQCLVVVSDVMNLIALMGGFVGLSNAGATGTATGDCSGCLCGWTYEWDFAVNGTGWTFVDYGGDVGGTLVPGLGFQAESNGSNAYGYLYETTRTYGTFSLAAGAKITRLEIDVSWVGDSPGGHQEIWVGTSRSDGLSNSPHIYTNTFPVHNGVDGERDGAISGLSLAFGVTWVGVIGVVQKVRVIGFGTEPAFTGGNFI